MKGTTKAAIVAAALLTAHLGVLTAETARFRHVASVYADDKGVGMSLPEGVACDATGLVLVADTGNNRLLRYTFKDKALSGGSEIRLPELSAPSRVQLGPQGDIYALDGKLRRIVHIGADGTFKGAVPLDSVPPPTTIVPKSFRIDSAGTFYVLDVFSARVLVLDPSGAFQKAIPLPPGAGFVTDLAVDTTGAVLLLDSIERRIYAAARDASSFEPLGGDLSAALVTLPTSISISKGTIFVLEGSGSSIVSLGRDGAFLSRQLTAGRAEGSVMHPSQLCITDADDVFLADRDNSRVQAFGLIR